MTKITNRQLNAVVIENTMIFLNNVTAVTQVPEMERIVVHTMTDSHSFKMTVQEFNEEILKQLNSQAKQEAKKKEEKETFIQQIDDVLGDL